MRPLAKVPQPAFSFVASASPSGTRMQHVAKASSSKDRRHHLHGQRWRSVSSADFAGTVEFVAQHPVARTRVFGTSRHGGCGRSSINRIAAGGPLPCFVKTPAGHADNAVRYAAQFIPQPGRECGVATAAGSAARAWKAAKADALPDPMIAKDDRRSRSHHRAIASPESARKLKGASTTNLAFLGTMLEGDRFAERLLPRSGGPRLRQYSSCNSCADPI